jgi:hypothetical protein
VKAVRVLEFSDDHGRLIAVKRSVHPVTDVYGCLGRKINSDTVMAQLRERQPHAPNLDVSA